MKTLPKPKPFLFLLVASGLLVLFPFRPAAAERPERTLTLRECVQIALENASAVRKAENALRLQGSDLLRSYGRFLPKVSVSADYTPSSVSKAYAGSPGGAVTSTDAESVDLALTTSLNLFNGFRDYSSLRAAMNRKDAAKFTLSRARQTIVFDVTQSYYQVLLDRELLRIARENLSSSRDQLQLTRRQYEIGLKPVTDYYQQQAETAKDELSVIRAENALRKSRLELLRRLRLDPAGNIDVATAGTDSLSNLSRPIDRDSLVTAALAARTDLKSARRAEQAAKWEVARAAGARYPTVDLSFIYASGGNPYLATSTPGVPETVYDLPPLSDQLSDLAGYSLRLSMNWTIFDGFLTRHAVEQAKVSYLNEGLDTGDLEHDIVIDVQLAADNYTAAFKQIETAEQGLRSAEKAYETVRKKYDLGAADFVEASTARTALVTARSDRAQAVYNLALQKNVLDFTAGTTPIE